MILAASAFAQILDFATVRVELRTGIVAWVEGEARAAGDFVGLGGSETDGLVGTYQAYHAGFHMHLDVTVE